MTEIKKYHKSLGLAGAGQLSASKACPFRITTRMGTIGHQEVKGVKVSCEFRVSLLYIARTRQAGAT